MLFDYITHRFDKAHFKIVMTILVKNEDDIIEQNIRTHAALGVDAFVVMDNDSTDHTPDILKKLQKEYEITVIEEKGLYDQARWMKRLAVEAKRLGADWVINNDADEFWIPKEGRTLREVLDFKGSVLTVDRFNMLLDPAAKEDGFLASQHRVENPVAYTKARQIGVENISMVLTKIGPKTIVNPRGLIEIRGGNHKAWHIANSFEYLFKKADTIKRFGDISVYHYPFRSYAQFKKNIENRKMLLESQKHIRMGPHYRRWVKLYNAGRLEEEYRRLLFSDNDIAVLSKYGIVTEDPYPARRIEEVLSCMRF
jgi:glycosyltransferase involved in cell wall biosynthesis